MKLMVSDTLNITCDVQLSKGSGCSCVASDQVKFLSLHSCSGGPEEKKEPDLYTASPLYDSDSDVTAIDEESSPLKEPLRNLDSESEDDISSQCPQKYPKLDDDITSALKDKTASLFRQSGINSQQNTVGEQQGIGQTGLRLKGIRNDVGVIMAELDASGLIKRCPGKKKIERRKYFSRGPNHIWHIDDFLEKLFGLRLAPLTENRASSQGTSMMLFENTVRDLTLEQRLWNTHDIRKQKNVAGPFGKPDILFTSPPQGFGDMLCTVDDDLLQYAEQFVCAADEPLLVANEAFKTISGAILRDTSFPPSPDGSLAAYLMLVEKFTTCLERRDIPIPSTFAEANQIYELLANERL
ncbi:hypothetical protein E1301_Tti021238 [Triplophysa tibetana]|uniref:Uncharacterized protein n=1 Tax=Triplophysa tibetana TaxID=1572043 RepID=A0A5A9PLA8_9TELE|nr:hypothetical protein E1301_Tti021238 [Triplophysa tibetana]